MSGICLISLTSIRAFNAPRCIFWPVRSIRIRVFRQLTLIAVCLAVCSAAALAQSRRVAPTPIPTPDDEVVKVSTEEIKLNVLAFDERGRFFPEVTPADVVIREDNVLHAPSSVRRIPANVLIVMDTGGEFRSVKSLDKTRRVALALIGALRPYDQVAVMTYADKPEVVSEWTSDRGQLTAAVKRTNFGRRSAFIAALDAAKQLFARSGVDNKHLVLITDGTDSTASGSAKFDALQGLLSTDITVHVLSYTAMEAVDIEPRTRMISTQPPPQAMPDMVKDQLPKGGPQEAAKRPRIGPTIILDRTLLKRMKTRKADLETSQEQLEKLAENTNGEFILPFSPEEMEQKAPLVAQMIDASYVVTYMPKLAVIPTRGIAERNIEVTSKRSGLILQSKRKVVLRVPGR